MFTIAAAEIVAQLGSLVLGWKGRAHSAAAALPKPAGAAHAVAT